MKLISIVLDEFFPRWCNILHFVVTETAIRYIETDWLFVLFPTTWLLPILSQTYNKKLRKKNLLQIQMYNLLVKCESYFNIIFIPRTGLERSTYGWNYMEDLGGQSLADRILQFGNDPWELVVLDMSLHHIP